ncbi:MAG TPA: FAD-binding protein [Acidimicrobiales bacterium]
MDLTGAAPVVCVGGRTQWDVGGAPVAGAVEVRAPAGVLDYEPAEMVVRVGAGTTVAELDGVLGAHGQMVPLDAPDPDRATVGGVLAVGRSGLRRLRYGPVRDTLLEARLAMADGTVVKAGGPVVKNVTGYDLCRLFVGSLGTIGFLAEAVLRCQPRPRVARWIRSDGADPFDARRRLFRPSSILWDGAATWVLLEGSEAEVAAERDQLDRAWVDVDGPPPVPRGSRSSMRPSELRSLSGDFVAEVGVGTVHRAAGDALGPGVPPSTVAIFERVKAAFDPTGRMNPGRQPW